MTTYNKSTLEAMTVKELREVIKAEDIALPGAWKAKKEDLIKSILQVQSLLEDLIEVEENDEDEEEYQEAVEDSIAAILDQPITIVSSDIKNTQVRRNKNKLQVKLNDGSILVFDSNKEFATFFNKKHETEFRNDIAWYLVRGRNKKAKETFEIDIIREIDEAGE